MIKKLFLCVFVTAFAAVHLTAQNFPEDSWREVADTTWYESGVNQFDIATAEELAGLSLLVKEGESFAGKTINIIADINLDGRLWLPIGYDTDFPFSGTVQGNNHVISNLWITGLNRPFLGLFGQSIGGEYYDIILDTAVIDDVGGSSGALVANMYTNGIMENCHARNVDITIIGSNVGGLVGSVMTDSYVKNCSFSGNVTGTNQVGGLVAQIWDKSTLSGSWSEGTVTGEYIVGGLIGFATMSFRQNSDNLVKNCYSQADVTATDQAGMAGGFYGFAQTNVTIKNCYSTGTVTSPSNAGGFAGKVGNIIVENVYFDTESSGFSNAIGTIQGEDPGIIGKTTAEMTTPEFATTLNAGQTPAPWLQDDAINEAYPYLDNGTMAVDQVESLSLTLYPTQVNLHFFIQSDKPLKSYAIYNMLGQKVAQGPLHSGENNIEVSPLSSGIYLVKIRGEKNTVTKKIIKR